MPEIAIDACVFIHLMHRNGINSDGHIDVLLNRLFAEGYALLVDSSGRITKDYEAQVIPMIKGEYEEGNQRYLLYVWMMQDRQVNVTLNANDQLMTAIKRIIHEADEHADRAFVYVACKQSADLISNDDVHILERRNELLKAAKKCGYRGTSILSSREA